MKICSPQLGMDPESILGGEIHDHFILQNLAKLGSKIYVYLPKDRSYQKNKNIFIERAPVKHILALTFNLISLPFIVRTFKREKFDILRIHSPYFLGFAATIFKFFHQEVPIVTTFHLRENNPFMALLVRTTINNYSGIITVSKSLKSWLVDTFKISPGKVTVIYNGVARDLQPNEKNTKLIKKYNLKNKVVILFVGLLNERKNPLFLLEVYRRLKKKQKNIALILCGDGPIRKKMEGYIKENKIVDATILGPVHGQQKADFFNLCDVFALPSRNEGFGLAVAEAMVCRKAVIVSDNSSLKEIVKDGEDGILAKTDDVKDWSQKLERLLIDKRLREKLGENAYRKAKNLFNWGKAALAHQKLFEKLTNA